MYLYPHPSVSQLDVPDTTWWELERRLLLVFLGRAHASSEVHGKVIERLESSAEHRKALEPLRAAAHHGKDAVYTGDFDALAQAMRDNTAAQEALHPALVSDVAKAVIALAQDHGCQGWKVNGAGGDGGSLTLLMGPDPTKRRRFVAALHNDLAPCRSIPIKLSRTGLRSWETQDAE